MTLYMLDIKKTKKQIYKYFIISMVFLVFGFIYELYGHGVYSYYMIYAFVVPLTLGFIVYGLIYKFHFYQYLSDIGMSIYNSFILALTLGSTMMGFLEIYGTTNKLIFVYVILSFIFMIMSIIINVIYHLKTTNKKKIKKEA